MKPGLPRPSMRYVQVVIRPDGWSAVGQSSRAACGELERGRECLQGQERAM